MNETKTNLTLKQRQRLQGKVQSEQRPTKGQGNSKEVSRIVAILLLLLAFGGGTALGMIYFRPDPRLQELDDVRALMADENVPQDVKSELGDQFRELADALPPDLRQRAWGGRGRGNSARMAKFFAMSSADQLAELEREAAREKEREARRAEREEEAAAKSADQAADSSKASSDSSSNGNSKGGGRKGMTDQQRTQRQEQRLSNRPPQQRSQGTLMHQMTNAVRQQNGLSSR